MIDLHLSRKLFNDVYYPYLFDYSHRVEVYYGGAGSGKSVFVIQKILVKALNDKRKVLVVRKVASSLNDSCWQLTLDTLVQWKLYDKCDIKLSLKQITLPNGSILLFKGLDDSEKIKSITGITDIWIEEATELTMDDFEQLTLRLRAMVDNLQIFLSFNPVSKANWVYKRWFSKEPLDTTAFILKTTYQNNRFLPQEYINDLESKIHTNPTYHKIYALGEFCSLDKLVYHNWKVEDFDYKHIHGDLLVGLDFGFSNDPAALIASIITGHSIYIFKEYFETNKTNPELVEVIKNLGFSKSIIIADSAEPKSIEEIRRAGIPRMRPSVKGPDSLKHGIQKLQQYDIYVHPSCTQTITEFENYAWKKDKKTDEYINEPIDQFNHLMDALRYSLQCQTVRLRSISKDCL